jgi:hypothetical protein
LPSYGFLIALIIAWLLVVNVAWLGAEVVFRHGLGVMSLPAMENNEMKDRENESRGFESSTDGHAHSHAPTK